MHTEYKTVTTYPLNEIWNNEGTLDAKRIKQLGTSDIRQLLRSSTVLFVIANVGDRLLWIPQAETFKAWKESISKNIIEPNSKEINLDLFSGNFAYLASLWQSNIEYQIILLEKYH